MVGWTYMFKVFRRINLKFCNYLNILLRDKKTLYIFFRNSPLKHFGLRQGRIVSGRLQSPVGILRLVDPVVGWQTVHWGLEINTILRWDVERIHDQFKNVSTRFITMCGQEGHNLSGIFRDDYAPPIGTI